MGLSVRPFKNNPEVAKVDTVGIFPCQLYADNGNLIKFFPDLSFNKGIVLWFSLVPYTS